MIRSLLATLLVAAALPVAAQSVPAANYTDMWWDPNESGWGISLMQHSGTNQAWAIWYTFDPRETDPQLGQQFKSLWIVMPGGSWTTPTTLTGRVYVLNGIPFNQSGSNRSQTEVGTFTFNFSGTSNATFTYNIAAPGFLPSTDPAFNLPTMSGSKSITRLSF